MNRILCPVDFSVFSARALRHAAALAGRFGARLTVLHVVPSWTAHAPAAYLPAPVLAQPSLAQLIRDDLAQFIADTRQAGLPLETLVREAEPWREIVACAEELGAELIVMGTHGRGGFERLLMGSVAEKVLRRAHCPVLTVCHEEGRPWEAPGLVRNVVCATDLSPASAPTIRYALALAGELEATLTLLHVLDRFALSLNPEYARIPITMEVVARHEEMALRDLKAAVPPEARERCRVVERVVPGRARDEILRVAAETQADLIVMGARRQGPLALAVMGSTSHDVVRAATCPVLTVRLDGGGDAAPVEGTRGAIVSHGA